MSCTISSTLHANDADPKVLVYKYLEMLPRLAESGNGYFVIPGELTEAVKTVTSAFAADHGAPRAANTARAAVDEVRAEAEQAQRNILG